MPYLGYTSVAVRGDNERLILAAKFWQMYSQQLQVSGLTENGL